MTEKVLKAIQDHDMIKRGSRVTAALSGGADSVCLLLALEELRDKLGFTLEAMHLNHMIRGAESDSDEAFCVRLCERLGISIKVFHEDIPKAAAERGISTELAAREIRYAKFYECAGDKGLVATAHTLSDNAETVVHNLVRGTGLKGLCGIPAVRGQIIRPLIYVTRDEVEEYLREHQQDFVTDSTNLSDDYTRNRIRHKIIPEFFNINSGFYKNFAATQKILNEENNYLEKLAKIAYNNTYSGGCLKFDKDCPEVIRKRVILRFLRESGLAVSFDRITDIDGISFRDGRISLQKGVFVKSRRGEVFIERDFSHVLKELCEGENSIYSGFTLTAVTEEYKGKPSEGILDPDKAVGKIVLRSRREGDKIRLVGRDFSSKVKKLLCEGVEPSRRQYIHFLADDEGLIFMEGFGCADRVKADESTARILRITVTDER